MRQGRKNPKENTKQHKRKEIKQVLCFWKLTCWSFHVNFTFNFTFSLTVSFSLTCRADAAKSSCRNCKLWDSSQHWKVSNCKRFSFFFVIFHPLFKFIGWNNWLAFLSISLVTYLYFSSLHKLQCVSWQLKNTCGLYMCCFCQQPWMQNLCRHRQQLYQ